jgi:hypothetical protein
LRYHSRVVEPLPVGLHAGDGLVAVLVDSGLGDIPLSITLSLAIGEALEKLDLLCVTKKLSVQERRGRKELARRNIPVEVLALGLDISHAIARLPLALLAIVLFLLDTHGDCFRGCCRVWGRVKSRIDEPTGNFF